MNLPATINGDQFDLAGFAMTRIDEGAPFVLLNLRTGFPLLRPDKTPVSITFVSQHSQVFRDIMREIQLGRARYRANQPPAPTQADVPPIPYEMEMEENADILTACAVSWNFTDLGGEPFPFSKENAHRLFSDPQYIWIVTRALNFIQGDGNFLSEGFKS